MSLRSDVSAIEERPKCKEAVRRMLELIAEIANYICNLVSSGIKGAALFCYPLFIADVSEDTLVTHEYQKKVHDFKDKFKKAKQDFSDSLQVEIIESVHRQGE